MAVYETVRINRIGFMRPYVFSVVNMFVMRLCIEQRNIFDLYIIVVKRPARRREQKFFFFIKYDSKLQIIFVLYDFFRNTVKLFLLILNHKLKLKGNSKFSIFRKFLFYFPCE